MPCVRSACVEQSRYPSRHAEVQQLLNGKASGGAYSSLPPHAESIQHMDRDLLDAMPPHVKQTLRQPHLGWKIGAVVVVRPRWFRPVAAVVVSALINWGGRF